MMLLNAFTTESPVTTVYRIAPNAAAATVPRAYSIGQIYIGGSTPLGHTKE